MSIYGVTLAAGIGDIIQTLPFMYAMKKAGHQVLAVPTSNVYSIDACKLVWPAYHKMINHNDLPKKAIFKGDLFNNKFNWAASKIPQWAAWFVWHDFAPPKPEEVETATDFQGVPWKYDIVLAPTCKPTWPMKMWPHWNDLIGLLPGRCAVIGLPGDGGNLYGDFEDFRGLLTLRQTAGLLKKAKIVISLEGGMAHLACANGTKTLILYGGTNWTKNLPPRNGVVVRSDTLYTCQPCQFGKCFAGRNQFQELVLWGCHHDLQVEGSARCMHSLTPQKVIKVLMETLGE